MRSNCKTYQVEKGDSVILFSCLQTNACTTVDRILVVLFALVCGVVAIVIGGIIGLILITIFGENYIGTLCSYCHHNTTEGNPEQCPSPCHKKTTRGTP
jgi:predicted lysophospholipase L1 biosynthesis ABC-type transport system permease subunit